jgi:predicted esterase
VEEDSFQTHEQKSTAETKQVAELLRSAGANVTLRFLQAGHELTPNNVDLAGEWLRELK